MAQRVSSSRFVGRRRELDELILTLSEGAREELPVLFFLAGESGVGKTRLLRELIGRAEADGAKAIGGSCIELGDDDLPYAPLVAALRPLHRTCATVLDQLPASARAELARLNPAIGQPSAEPESERGEAQRRLFDAFIELISLLSEEQPVLLWIEDIHWADRSTRSFLKFLSASLSDERVLVVATYRADELHRRHPLRPLLAELERSERARRIELTRFDEDELAAQLTDILGEPPDRDSVQRLFSRSDGNPLFTEELLAAGTDGRGSPPPSLREALLLRSERMSEQSQQLLRLLAVAGRAGEDLLAAASGLDPAALSAALREGMDAQIVIIEGELFALRHALLREVLYDDLLPGQRADLHLRIAAALEGIEPTGEPAWTATAVAHHYYAAGDQPQALTAAIGAATAVRGLHAYGEAAGLLDRALALWPRIANAESLTGIGEDQLLADAARVHYLDGEDAVAMALYERAIEAVGPDADPERLAGLLTTLATCQWSLGRAGLSRETQRRGLDLLPPESNSPARAALLAQQVRFLLLQGRFREVCEAAPEAIELTHRLGMDSARAGVLNRFGCALFGLGREREGRERMIESVELAERTGQGDDLATAYLNYADALHIAGHGAEARSVAERGVARVQDRTEVSEGGSSRSIRYIRLNLAEIYFDLGEWDLAEAQLAVVGSATQGTARAHARLRSAQVALARGRDEDALDALGQAEELLRDALEPQYIAMLAAYRAEAEIRRGRLDTAQAAIDSGIDRIQFCSEDGGRIAQTAAAGMTVEAEIAQRARDLADEAGERAAISRAGMFCELVRAAAEEAERPIESALLTFAEAEAARARGEDDPALWSSAAETWRDLPRPYQEAIARWRQSGAALARGDRDAAKAPLIQAREIAERLGATWLAGEVSGLAARARLTLEPASAGDEAKPSAAEAPFGLTPRELQVLELVSAGATNREIGERLYMAEKTASVHVSRILAKLEVRGRTEAAAVAHRHGIGVPGARGGE